VTTPAGIGLRTLKEHPFELLREIERRCRVALTGGPGDDAQGEEWVGIGLRLGNERFVVAREEVREVLMLPPALTRVPGARDWMRGLANVRGHLLPLADLRGFLGAGAGGTERNARVLVVHSSEFPVGLIVDEVYGFRRFVPRERVTEFPQPALRVARYLDGAFRRGLEVWPVLRVEKLLLSREFQRAAED
jgi:twitching motility protein PilI